MTPSPVVILSTTPESNLARSIARTLVDEELAACCTIVDNVLSIYRWNSGVEETTECLMVIKTTTDRVTALTERVTSLHPYDVPEIVVLDVDGGSQPYLNWIIKMTRGG